jgi:predicted DNA-binding protein
MTRKVKRRSVSLSGTTYHRLKNFCHRTGEPSIAGYVDRLLNAHLAAADEPVITAEDIPEPAPKKPKELGDPPGAYFTF